MKKVKVYRSPVISYEVVEHDTSLYGLNVVVEEHPESGTPCSQYFLSEISEDRDCVESMALYLSKNHAVPEHIPELVEAMLSEISADNKISSIFSCDNML